MILCRNSKCPHQLRLYCKRYKELMRLASIRGKLKNYQIETFEPYKDSCDKFIKA